MFEARGVPNHLLDRAEFDTLIGAGNTSLLLESA
jgi:hypothetical protein